MSILGWITGSDKARKSISAAGDQARAQQQAGYDDVSSMYAPLREGGTRAYSTLQDIAGLNGAGAQQGWYDNYVASPDVAARTAEGIRTLDNSYAGRNLGTVSGGMLKALTKYGTDQATQDINNRIGLISNISNTGNNAIGATANARLGLSSGMANSFQNEGTEMANSYLADGSFLGNLISGGMRLAGTAGVGAPSFNPFRSTQTGSLGNMARGW